MAWSVLQMVKSRTFILEQLDKKGDTGLFDPRVFKGGNNLRAVMDGKTTMWSFKMDKGLVPIALRDKFTSLNELKKHANSYFTNKNIKIVDLI